VNDERISEQSAKEEIAREIVKVHAESYGERASELKVAIEADFVVAMMNIDLSPAERTLIEAGNHDSVRVTRESFQSAIAPTFRAIVERATGRTVSSFASRTVLEDEPPWSVEVFRLEAPADT
jgi:uncharacterized protein YbcI